MYQGLEMWEPVELLELAELPELFVLLKLFTLSKVCEGSENDIKSYKDILNKAAESDMAQVLKVRLQMS
jgi:hypothetical protein